MSLPGAIRVCEVYPVWFLVYAVAILPMLFYRKRAPTLVFWLVMAFMIKDIGVDYFLAGVPRPRVYWAEHAPLLLWLVLIGVGDMCGVVWVRGYIGRYTTLLAALTLLVDVYRDLIESPVVYGR